MSTYPLFFVNGVPMDDSLGRWASDPSQPLRTLPGHRNVSVTVPGRDGVIWTDNAGREPAPFAIHLLVLGRGNDMDARVADLEQNLDALNYLFGSTGIFEVVLQTSATQFYWGLARLAGSSTPDRINLDAARVTFLMELPDGGWRGHTEGSYTGTAAVGANGSIHHLAFLDGSTRPVPGLRIMAQGPFPIFAITDRATRQNISLPYPVLAGQYLRIDTDAMQATVVSSFSWTADGVDVSGNAMLYGPGSDTSWLRPLPKMVGTDPSVRRVEVEMAVGSATGPRNVTILGRKAY